MNEEIELAQMEMEEAVNAFRHELARVRTGRASTALLENLYVNYYGTRTPLRPAAGGWTLPCATAGPSATSPAFLPARKKTRRVRKS